MGTAILIAVVILIALIVVAVLFVSYKKIAREAKNYERGLKMVPMYIHIPPSTEDIDSNGSRDQRERNDEALSQAQTMYNILASTYQKSNFKNKIYGQRQISFEILAQNGLIHYYVLVPSVLTEVVKQAILAAYSSARLEEIEEHNIFSPDGKIAGTVGGEFALRRDYYYPIATFQESKKDASRAILNAMSSIAKEDGAAIQILIRSADEIWTKNSANAAAKIRKEKGSKKNKFFYNLSELTSALVKPPAASETKSEDKQLSTIEQSQVEAIEEKTKHPGFETLIRVVVSAKDKTKAEVILSNIVAAFSLYDSPNNNGFKFIKAKEIEALVTSYIFRFFPQSINRNILNSIELATIFHLPDQKNIPTSQVQRQMFKQVDGPTEEMTSGFIIGFNEFRGNRREIRVNNVDRRRHIYFIGQTGTGKSSLLENLAYQDMLEGKGLAFIDPHGDSAEKLLGLVPHDRVDDIIYFNPADMEHPMGLNLFEFESDDQRDFLIQEAIAMLYKLYDPTHSGIVGPRYEHWFRNAALTIMSDPAGSTFIDIPQVFTDQAFTDEKLKFVKDRTVLDFWSKEMGQTSEANKSEVLGWFVSKFGAFLSNEMMRNIIGQVKSGFNLRDIMDNKKILLVNLSKGLTGELNSQLLGMIFIMKFQAAAMGRANIPEDQREDFSLYVDEFQNFATDSFATILSEARKYRLSLILANQFMTQLTDNIRESILGNIGTVISGRLGITDAEVLQKKFMPTYNAEDLTKLPNFQSVTSVLINGVPSASFSMALNTRPMAQFNQELHDAVKKLSATKFGRPRREVEEEIFTRLGAGDAAKKAQLEQSKSAKFNALEDAIDSGDLKNVSDRPNPSSTSFLDDWLARRKKIIDSSPTAKADTIHDVTTENTKPQLDENIFDDKIAADEKEPSGNDTQYDPNNPIDVPKVDDNKRMDIRGTDSPADNQVHIKLR